MRHVMFCLGSGGPGFLPDGDVYVLVTKPGVFATLGLSADYIILC